MTKYIPRIWKTKQDKIYANHFYMCLEDSRTNRKDKSAYGCLLKSPAWIENTSLPTGAVKYEEYEERWYLSDVPQNKFVDTASTIFFGDRWSHALWAQMVPYWFHENRWSHIVIKHR